MEAGGVRVMVSTGAETTILGAEGNAENIDREKRSLLPGGPGDAGHRAL
jgi:3-deoxy-7-phosphoheptulonate synthase